MGRKGKKQEEKGSSSPEGPQASPAASKAGKASPSSDEVPGNEVPKDKLLKKQKSSPTNSSKEHGSGKSKTQTNGHESSEDAKKTVRQKRKVSQGVAIVKDEGGCCSLCCVVLLSALVAVVAAAGYAAYTVYPAESEQLIGQLDTHLQLVVQSVNAFVRSSLDKILNTDQKATDEQMSETEKFTADDFVESRRHERELREEEEESNVYEEHGSENLGEFEAPIIAEKTDHLEEEKVTETAEVFEDGDEVEQVIIDVEEQDLGPIVEKKVRETAVEYDDDAEFEERADEELEQETGEVEDEDDAVHQEITKDHEIKEEEEEETAEHFDQENEETAEHFDQEKEDTAEHFDQENEETAEHFDQENEETAEHFDQENEETAEHIDQEKEETAEHFDQEKEETAEHFDQEKEEATEHFEQSTDSSVEDDVGEEPLQAKHLEENVEQKFEETMVEDDAAEFEEQIDDELEQDVDELTDEEDVLHWELAEDHNNAKEATEEKSERPTDGATGDDHDEEELHFERGQEQFEELQETENIVSDNEQKVSEQNDVKNKQDIQETIHQEPSLEEVSQTEKVSAQDAEGEVQVEVMPSHQQMEEVHAQEVLHVPSEYQEQEVPAQEVPEVVIPRQELPPEESQTPVDGSMHKAPAEKAETEMETISSERVYGPEAVEVDLEVGDETVDSLSNFEAAEPKSPDAIVYEDSTQQHVDENERYENVEELRRVVEETAGETSAESDILSKDSDGFQESLKESSTREQSDVEDMTEVQLEKELDYIDGLIDQTPREAIKKYDRILSVFHENARAIIGKAKALGALADAEQNDNILEQSIAEYLKVFSLPSVPKSLVVEAGRACAERQTIRGWGGAAAQTLRSLVSLYPDDLVLCNELGQKYLVNGAYDEARATFKEILSKDPNDASAMLYLGYIMKAVDRELSLSLEFMKTGLVSVPVSDLKFYVELGEALTRAGRHNEAVEVYQLAVDRRLLKSVWQRSWFNIDGLTERPWWTVQQTKNVLNIQILEDFRRIIREEANSILVNKSSLFYQDSSDIVESGEIKHMKLFVNGQKVTENCEAAVKTCSLLEAFPDVAECSLCEAKFTIMQPGLHLLPRCGPTNGRLTFHLPLIVSSEARIRVADETRTYGGNSKIIFDDSFEHELWVGGDAHQLVLTVEMWHPDLTYEQKSTLDPL